MEEERMDAEIFDHNYSIAHGNLSPNEDSPLKLSPLDNVIMDFMSQQQIPGASLALSLNDKILYKQGYGIAGPGRRTTSFSLFRIASLSKPITAIAIMRLVEEESLSLDAKVFGPKGILTEYKPTKKGDHRILNITIKHLLQHSAGWDRDQVGDPVFWKLEKVSKDLDPTSNEALIKYMMTKKLQFAPGKRHAYSNLGYLILGMILERVTQMTYMNYIHSLMRHLGADDIYVGHRKRVLVHYNEVEYFNNREPTLNVSVYPKEEGLVVPQYGGFKMEDTEAYGGIVTSSVDLLKVFNNLSCKREKTKVLKSETFKLMLQWPTYQSGKEWYGLGFDVQDEGQTWGHTGAMEGTSTTFLHHKSGFSWVLLFNSWSKDMDIDGLVKFGLSLVPEWPLYSKIMKTLDYKSKYICNGMQIVSEENLQVIQLLLPVNKFKNHVKDMMDKQYMIISVNLFVYLDFLYVNIIWNKNLSDIELYCKLFNERELSLFSKECEGNYTIILLDLCSWNQNIYHVVVYKLLTRTDNPQIVLYLEQSKQYLEKLSSFKNNKFNLKIQSVTQHDKELYISAVFEKSIDIDIKDISWLQITTENFLFELNKQVSKKLGLIYLKFYTVDDDPCVSAIWSSSNNDICLQRHNASIYGFLYELIQSIKNKRRVKCINSYYNDGVLNFAAIWDGCCQ